MGIQNDTLREIPLFRNITDAHLDDLVGAFEKATLEEGEVLFKQGSKAQNLFILVSGSATLKEDGTPRFQLQSPAPVGELGALTGRPRAMTAEVSKGAEVWKISGDNLLQFFEDHGDIAFPVCFNLLGILSDKIRRDGRRIDEMRTNIIRTQKAMKRMRDLVLESKETALSETLHDTLQDLIGRNRKSNYVVTPPASIPISGRMSDGTDITILRLSAVWLVISQHPDREALEGEHWSGVLSLRDSEVPISGTVREADGASAVIEMDLLIEEYAELLEDYLTRVQMLDVVV